MQTFLWRQFWTNLHYFLCKYFAFERIQLQVLEIERQVCVASLCLQKENVLVERTNGNFIEIVYETFFNSKRIILAHFPSVLLFPEYCCFLISPSWSLAFSSCFSNFAIFAEASNSLFIRLFHTQTYLILSPMRVPLRSSTAGISSSLAFFSAAFNNSSVAKATARAALTNKSWDSDLGSVLALSAIINWAVVAEIALNQLQFNLCNH